MISYILETARASGLFDVIHVSTEDEHVRNTVENLGLVIDFPRPSELADDYTPIMPVLKYVTGAYADRGQHFDEIWSLMACAPFVEPGDLHGMAEMLPRAGGHRAVLAVSQYPVPIEWAYTRTGDGSLTPVMPGMFAVRSQDIEKKYFDTGSVVAFPDAMVSDSVGPGSDSAYVGYVLERKQAIDIDDESDWELAEFMFHSLHR